MTITAAQHAELAAQWAQFPDYLQRALRDFARYPYVTGNMNYVIGYLGGLRDAKVMTQEAYRYALALPAEMQTDLSLRHELLTHAQRTVPLHKVAETA